MFNARNALDKSISAGGSNNTEVWWQSPQPPETIGVRGRIPPSYGNFTAFFQKISNFRHIGSKFLLKTSC